MTASEQILGVMGVINHTKDVSASGKPILVERGKLEDYPDYAAILDKLEADFDVLAITQRPKLGDVDYHASVGFYDDDFLQRGVSYEITIKPTFDALYTKLIDEAPVKNTEPNKRMAVLSFARYSTPEVIIGGQPYHLATMRGGNAFNIIEYCLGSHANKMITLEKLKTKLNLSGVTNINSALQKSPFDKNNGVLRMFVASSPQAITVNNTALLDDKQLEALKQRAKKSEF